MTWPLSQDYNEAIQDPAASFGDAELKQGQAATNSLGIPMPRSGNFADVYEVTTPGGKWAVKCFTRQIPGIRERYKEVSGYLKQTPLPFMVECSYLEQGIRVRGDWYPVLKMHWIEGFNLNQWIKDNLGKPQLLEILSQIWVKLAGRLRDSQMAHCDLQHGNVLLVPGSKAGSLAVKLVDYDGMCVPALAQLRSIEVGHPNFQHPQRARENIYGLEVDRFSHLVIYAAVRALMSGGKSLWERFDNGDNLLFKAADFERPGKSPVFNELLRKNGDAGVQQLVETMLQALEGPLDQTPRLADVVANLPPFNASAVITRSVPAPAPTAASAPVRSAPVPFAPEPTDDARADDESQDDEAAPPSRRKRRARKNGILIGAAVMVAVGVLALGGSGALLILSKGKKPQGAVALAQVPPNNPPPREPPGGGNIPDPKVNPNPVDPVKDPPKVEPDQNGVIDLLKLIDVNKNAVKGKWTMVDGALISPADQYSHLQIPCDVPTEYRLTITATPIRDGNPPNELFVRLIGDGRPLDAMVDGFNGKLSGLGSIDGKFASGNETTFQGSVFTIGRASKVVYTVRRKRVTIVADGKEIIHWRADFRRVTSVWRDWFSPNPKRLLVGTHRPYKISELTLREIKAEAEAAPEPGPAQAPAAAAPVDAQFLAAVPEGKGSKIALFKLDGDRAVHVRDLTDAQASNRAATWSPDGKTIAFASNREGPETIYLMDAEGKNVRSLTPGSAPSWSPDGKKIAFSRAPQFPDMEIFVMNADGTNSVNLTRAPSFEGDPAWSPDGKWIAFTSNRAGGYHLYVMAADGTGLRKLSEVNNRFGNVFPAWSPDSKRLAYGDIADGALEVHVCDADGGNRKQLSRLGGHNSLARWSPDGEHVFFVHNFKQDPRLYRIKADGSSLTEITGITTTYSVSWQPAQGAAPPVEAEAGRRTTVDLLPLIDVTRDVVKGQGKWAKEGNVLRCDDQHLAPRVQIRYEPPEEYDFEIEFSQPMLRHAIIALMPNRHGGVFFWEVGMDNGDGFMLSGNLPAVGAPNLLKPNTRHTTVVQVRRDSVRCLLDGKELVKRQTDFATLTNDRWTKMPEPRFLGVGCDDPTIFHALRVIEISGPGKRVPMEAVAGEVATVPLRFKNGGYVSLANTTGLLDWNKEVTVEMYLKLPEPAPNRQCRLIGDYRPGMPYTSWAMNLYTSAPPGRAPEWGVMGHFSSETRKGGRGSHVRFNGDEWHHLALVQEGGTLHAYGDGKWAFSVPMDANIKRGTALICIGGRLDKGPDTLDGELRGLRISSTARYKNRAAFVPPKELANDPDTLLLLEFSGKGRKLVDLAGKHTGAMMMGAEWARPARPEP
jgi:hypothetical protein